MGRTQLWVAALLLFLQQSGRILCHSQVYTVLLDDEPVITKFGRGSPDGKMVEKLRELDAKNYADYLTNKHDLFLKQTLEPGSFEKLYSHTHVINGFSVKLNDAQVKLITKVKGVQSVYKSRRATLDTTRTPTFLGLNRGAWQEVGGEDDAGEGVVIGMVDTGIDCSHPSFQNNGASKPYSLTLPHFYGHCDIGPRFPKGSCNGKIIGARFFNKAAKALGRFNTSQDFESPFDQDGHGTHTSSTAAGNSNVPVILNDVYFGNASGMAPRARVKMENELEDLGVDTQTSESPNDSAEPAMDNLEDILLQIWRELYGHGRNDRDTFRSFFARELESLRTAVENYQINIADVQVCKLEEQISSLRKEVACFRSQLNKFNALLCRLSNTLSRNNM